MTYAGRVRHKGSVYPGQHDAIVEDRVWTKAQEILAYNGRTGGKSVRNKHGALLKGLLRCVPCDAAMGHSYTVKGAKRYRYYVCVRAQKQGWGTCPSKSVPAAEIERFVVERIRAIGEDPEVVAATLAEAGAQHAATVASLTSERTAHQKELRTLGAEMKRLAGSLGRGDGATARLADLQERVDAVERRLTEVREKAARAAQEAIDERDLSTALSLFDPVWDALFPREQARVLRLLVERVGYDGGAGTLAITFRPSGIRALAQEVGGGDEERSA